VTLTLDAAISMATANSHVMRMAGARVQERAAAARGARAELFPMLRAEAQYQGSTGNSSIEIPAGVLGEDASGSPFPHQNKRIEQDGSQVFFSSVTMSQPLTQIFKIREGSLAARAALMKSKADERGTAMDVALAVEKLYLGTLVAQRKQDAAAALVVARRALLTDAERQSNTGMGLEVKVSEARAGLLDAEQSYLTAEISAEDRQAELMQLLGMSKDVGLRLTMPEAQGSLGSLDEYLSRATDRHPDVAAASADLEHAMRGLRATKADYIPDVAVYAKHSYQDAVAFLPGNSFSAGIRASWDVLDFGRRRSAVEQRVASQRLAEENLANTRETVAVEVEKAYRNAVRAERLVSVARQSLEARLAVERIAAGQTGAGLTLVSKQSEAAANRAAAESALVEAELGARIARAELAHAVGERLGSGSIASSEAR
jgi:outer membrane protein TolC